MASAQPQQQQQHSPSPPHHETAASNIRALSDLSGTLPLLLRSCATATSQLTNAPIPPNNPDYDPHAAAGPAEARINAIEITSRDVLALIAAIRNNLFAQIDALEAAKVIPPAHLRFIAPVQLPPGQQQLMGPEAQRPHDPEASVTNGGLGDFDVGVLNATAGIAHVGGDEVLTRVMGVLEKLASKGESEDTEMVDG